MLFHTRCVGVVLACLLATQGWAEPFQEEPTPAKISIVILDGDGAINNVRQRVAREPIVQVEDENHKPLAGAVVTFTLPNQGASASFADGAKTLTVTTDSKGQAVARGMRPNNVNGQYQVRVNASYRGQTANASIGQTNAFAAAAAAAGGISAKLIALIVVGAAAGVAGGLVAANRGGGNNTPPVQQTTITAGTPTVGGPR